MIGLAAQVRRGLLVLLTACLVGALVAPTASAASLQTRIDRVVRSSSLAQISSVYVWDQQTRRVIYSVNSSRAVTPASTMKLLTSAAALSRYGPSHRFETRLALDGTQRGSRFVGDVWLIGGGDPSLSTGGFARDNFGGRGTNIARLVQPLKARGITVVQGRIRVDDDRFDEQRWVREWKPAFRFDESGALGALTVNASATGRWIGTGITRRPDVHAGETFRAMLRRDGIRVTGRTVPGSVPERAESAGRILSPPLSALLAHMNSSSDNFFAEILLKQVGVDYFGARADGSTRQGRVAALRELRSLGVDMTGVRWLDGSGLAYGNRVTTRALGQVLGVGAQASWGEQWTRGFARSGTYGTLRRRMTRAPYRGRVMAKTGTLRHVSALAGFSERRANGRRYGFAVVTSHPGGGSISYASAHALQDRIAMALVR